MHGWTLQTIIGVVGGSSIFAAILLPLLVVHYRRFGRVSPARLLGTAALSVYAVALIAYTLLPLPVADVVCAGGGVPAQPRLFAFVDDIRSDVVEHGVVAALTARAALQVALNVALFVPLGIIARGVWRAPVGLATAIGLLVSLLIEATQLTGMWGLYPCAYRVADVDDLLANTVGALLGALLAPVLLWWMPAGRRLRAGRLTPRSVTARRRWLGMVIDAGAFVTAAVLLSGVATAVRLARDLTASTTTLEDAIVWSLAGVLTCVVPSLVGTGASIGQRVVWLAPDRAVEGRGRPSLVRRVIRAISTEGLAATGVVLAVVWPTAEGTAVWIVLVTLLIVVAVVAVPFTHDRRGLSGMISGTRPVDVR